MVLESYLATHFLARAVLSVQPIALYLERPALPKPSVISVVDDDVSVRVATDNLLSSHGYQVHTFASAEEFLQSNQLNRSLCVVADVQMPGMGGLELLTQMRTLGHKAPFIFITAFPKASVRAKALAAGAVCLLAKPFPGPVLIDCIETALDEHPGQAGH
jgi:FixJ family two-component response regulator